MVAKLKILRNNAAGVRPAGKTAGEPYVNFADNQLGVFDLSGTPVARDLLGVPVFSSLASYTTGNPINYNGRLYIANTSVPAGAFNPAQWTQVSGGGGGGGATVVISATAPASPAVGTLWWDTVGGQMYIWYDDGTSQQWIVVTNQAPAIAPSGAYVSPTAPSVPSVGQFWWDTVSGQLFIWYDDGTSQQWVSIT